MKKYSFCETVTAAPLGLWHIRKLTKNGYKYGGGADTKALCGKKVSWDMAVDITKYHLENNTCKKCLNEYFKLMEES